MKGRSKSSGLDREGDSPAERSPQVTSTERRPGAANLKTLKVGLAGPMSVNASHEMPTLKAQPC